MLWILNSPENIISQNILQTKVCSFFSDFALINWIVSLPKLGQHLRNVEEQLQWFMSILDNMEGGIIK